MIIRNESENDFREVEELTRKAFWNLYCPGCNEHYLVHIMRNHEDFIPELDYVIEENNKIIANIMFTKSKLINELGIEKETLTFGPISVLPEYQRKGYGKKIINHSLEKAVELGYDMVIIFGNPENYVCNGFISSKKYNISINNNNFPTALLAKQLHQNAITKANWTFKESNVYEIDTKKAEQFDKTFEPLLKEYKPCQELFYIYSHSQLI